MIEVRPEGTAAGGDPWAADGGPGAAEGAGPVPPSQLLGTEPGPIAGTGSGFTSAVPGPSATGTPAYRSDANVDVTGETLSALRAAGMPGRGVIREAGDIGISIGEGRLFRLRLDVIPSEGLGYRLDHIALVPANARWRIVTGVTLPLFIDRSEPARLAIDWSA
jgi:hypothetical protein